MIFQTRLKIFRSLSTRRFLAFLLMMMWAFSSMAYDKVWQGGPLSQWDNPDNWNPIGVPTQSQSVLIPNAAVEGPIIGLLDTAYADAIHIENQQSLLVNGVFVVGLTNNSGSITILGTMTVHGKIFSGVLSNISITVDDGPSSLLYCSGELTDVFIAINDNARFENEGLVQDGVINTAGEGVFVNFPTGTITDVELTGSHGQGGLMVNEGTMTSVHLVNVDTFLNTTNGTVEIIGGFANMKKFTNHGQVDIESNWSSDCDAMVNDGQIHANAGWTIRGATYFNNNIVGVININEPAGKLQLLNNGSDFPTMQNSGTLNFNNSIFNQITGCGGCATHQLFNMPLGSINGIGEISADHINFNGIVSIGYSDSIGILELSSYSSIPPTIGPGHKLLFEIAGQAGGGQAQGHDSLKLTNHPRGIGGTLEIRLLNGFYPEENDSFHIISSIAPIVDSFESVIAPDLDTLGWQVVHTDNGIYVKVVDNRPLILYVSDVPTNGGIFTALQTINSDATIPNTAQVIFRAGQEVNLLPSFQTNLGATLDIKIE